MLYLDGNLFSVNGIIKSTVVYNAMLAVDRKDFCHTREAYKDNPQPIGSNVTISAPHMHAHALETLAAYLQPGSKVLDVGCGSGYLTTCMAIMVCHVSISTPYCGIIQHAIDVQFSQM